MWINLKLFLMNTFTHKTIKAQNKNGTALQFFVENFIK